MAQSRTPWARFTLLSADHPAESDHIYFSRPQHKIGRSAERCDVVLDLQYISNVHCVVTLEGQTAAGVPTVRLEDKSRNGVWVNGNRVGKGNSAMLESGFTVHFTRPGLKAAGVAPRIYKFEVLQLEAEVKPEAASTTQDLNVSGLGSPASARPLSGGSPAKKKRRRSFENDETVLEDPRDAEIRELAAQLEESKRQFAAATATKSEVDVKRELALEKAQAARDELANQVQSLAAERRQLASKVADLTLKRSAEVAEHESQHKALQQQVTERDSELDALKRECDEAKRALEGAEGALNERNKQFAALKAENSGLATRLAASEKRVQQAAESTVGADESDKLKEAEERQRRAKEEIAALRRELDANRLRIRELENKASESSVTVPASLHIINTSADSSEVFMRLQQQLAVARGFFKEIQAIGAEGESVLARVGGGAIDAAADSPASGLIQGDGSTGTAEPVSAAAEETKNDHEPVETTADDDAMEVDPDVDAHEEEPADTEQELPDTEATKAPESVRDLADDVAEGETSDKSSSSRSTTLGSAEADTE